MPSNKDRIYIALYARGGSATMPGGEDTYHWALIVGPKLEVEDGRGTRFHAKSGAFGEWYYDEMEISLLASQMILVRVMIGKVIDMHRLVGTLRNVPVVQNDPRWNCVEWVRNALEALRADGHALGTSQLDWNRVRDAAMRYCQQKKDQHRFDGMGAFNSSEAATYDLLEGRETIA
ncbi:MAG: hypothetical protein M1832_005123 [Thelocarpon impressellum]|nr:MAG: hypothetical protein M1832_005123 [Thelocarpon impressellum]